MIVHESWSYGYCETCRKNAHEDVQMVKQQFASGDPKASYKSEMWVCPKCGASKLL
jgi:hypothetical protein